MPSSDAFQNDIGFPIFSRAHTELSICHCRLLNQMLSHRLDGVVELHFVLGFEFVFVHLSIRILFSCTCSRALDVGLNLIV